MLQNTREEFPPEFVSPSMIASIDHIVWTLSHSPDAYKMLRKELRELGEMLVSLEIKEAA